MGRSPCCSKEGLNRGAWTAHEDKVLTDYIRLHGEGKWRNLPKKAGLKRCGKSCRLRWLNYLRPDIKRGNISSDEEELIIRLHNLLGNRWSLIAGRLPGRTDNEIKNYWNTNLGKKVKDLTNTNTKTNSTSSSPPTPNKLMINISTGKRTKTARGAPPPKPKLSPTPPPFPPHPKLPIPNSNIVVRTKATKCSKLFFINSSSPPIMQQQQQQQQLQTKSEAEAEPVNNAVPVPNNKNDSMISNQIMEPPNCNAAFPAGGSTSDQEKDDHHQLSTTEDLLIDFNVEDMDMCLMSELMNSDFTNMCNFSYNYDDDEIQEPLSSPACNSDTLPLFSQEILKDWTQTQTDNVSNSNNIHSFTSFLQSSTDDQEMLY